MAMTNIGKLVAFAMSCFLIIFGFPGQSVGISALTESILDTTGISRNLFSTIYMISMFIAGILSLMGGVLIGKIGIKKSVMVTLLLWTTVLALLGWSASFYDSIFVGILNKKTYFIVVFSLALPLLRFFAKSMMIMLGRIQIMEIFHKNYGMAFAIVGVAMSIIAGLAPRIMHNLSSGGLWCDAYSSLATFSVFSFFIFLFFFPNTSSRKFTDGKLNFVEDKNLGSSNINDRFHILKLLKQRIFWCLTLPIIIQASILGGIAIHVVDIFDEKGLNPSTARGSYLYMSCCVIAANFVFGKIFSKRTLKSCILAMLFFQLCGLIGLNMVSTKTGFVAYILCMGFAWGAYNITISAAFSEVFGHKNISNILGIVYSLLMIIEAGSIPLMSISRTLMGSYFIFIKFIILMIISSIIFVSLNFPRFLKNEAECLS